MTTLLVLALCVAVATCAFRAVALRVARARSRHRSGRWNRWDQRPDRLEFVERGERDA